MAQRDPSEPMPIAGTRMPQEAPAATGRTSRPSWCGGAVLMAFEDRRTRRVKCNAEAEVITRKIQLGDGKFGTQTAVMGLCSRCSALEAENRAELRDKAADSGPRQRVGRKYDE